MANSSKYLKRRFTMREIILLGVLLVVLFVGLYFGLVYYPLASRTSEVQSEIDDLELQITVAQNLKRQYDDMKAELERIETTGGDKTVMPLYDGNHQLQELTKAFDGIFKPTGIDYLLTNSVGAANDGVRTRVVGFRYTVTDANKGEAADVYTKVRETLVALLTTGFRCSMTSLSIAPGADGMEASASIAVSCSINFYELDS